MKKSSSGGNKHILDLWARLLSPDNLVVLDTWLRGPCHESLASIANVCPWSVPQDQQPLRIPDVFTYGIIKEIWCQEENILNYSITDVIELLEIFLLLLWCKPWTCDIVLCLPYISLWGFIYLRCSVNISWFFLMILLIFIYDYYF